LISIGRKWDNLWRSEESTKITQFSNFKLVSVPLIIYGYYFYLCNKGAYNIFSFNSEIYDSFYSNVATFAYYVPDIFFFISGYLLTKDVFTEVEFAGNKSMFLLGKLGKKILRLYPIYIACLVIFWSIVPSLHSGPVWMIYAEEINRCDTVWWRNILMIDNFFTSGCFNFSWWVQA
jgi:peptidoglycan/LPS O-acetylase OafA/YrhL